MTKEEANELIQKHLQGDTYSSNKLFQEIMLLVGFFLKRSKLPLQDRPDVLQETLIYILKNIDKYDSKRSSLSTFVFWRYATVLRNFKYHKKKLDRFILLPSH